MESEVLLILALLGGYLFIHVSHFLRYRAQALNGTRLIFETATAGLPFLAISRLVVALLPWPDWTRESWRSYAGLVPYSATIAGALILAIVAALSMNVIVGWMYGSTGSPSKSLDFVTRLTRSWAGSRRVSLSWAIERYGNSLQKTQHFAATHTDEGFLVGVTLANRRIYAGFVVRSPDLTPNDGFVELLPAMSGYRRPDDLAVNYDYLYPAFQPGAGADPRLEVGLVLPIAEIQSLHLLERTDLESSLQRLVPRKDPTPDTTASPAEGRAQSVGAAATP